MMDVRNNEKNQFAFFWFSSVEGFNCSKLKNVGKVGDCRHSGRLQITIF